MAREYPSPTLEDIANIAKRTALEASGHTPMVVVEGDANLIAIPLQNLADTPDARTQQMFGLAYELAKKGEVGVLQQVFFISEAWLSVGKNVDWFSGTPPSQDPERREVLFVTRMNVSPHKSEVVMYEIKRDDAEKVIAIENLEDFKDEDAQNPLLEAFVMGFFSVAGATHH